MKSLKYFRIRNEAEAPSGRLTRKVVFKTFLVAADGIVCLALCIALFAGRSTDFVFRRCWVDPNSGLDAGTWTIMLGHGEIEFWREYYAPFPLQTSPVHDINRWFADPSGFSFSVEDRIFTPCEPYYSLCVNKGGWYAPTVGLMIPLWIFFMASLIPLWIYGARRFARRMFKVISDPLHDPQQVVRGYYVVADFVVFMLLVIPSVVMSFFTLRESGFIPRWLNNIQAPGSVLRLTTPSFLSSGRGAPPLPATAPARRMKQGRNLFSHSNNSGGTIITDDGTAVLAVPTDTLLSVNITGDTAGTVTIDFSQGNPLPASGIMTDSQNVDIVASSASDTLLTTAAGSIFMPGNSPFCQEAIRYPFTSAVTFEGAGPGDNLIAVSGTATLAGDLTNNGQGSTAGGPTITVNTFATTLLTGNQHLSALNRKTKRDGSELSWKQKRWHPPFPTNLPLAPSQLRSLAEKVDVTFSASHLFCFLLTAGAPQNQFSLRLADA